EPHITRTTASLRSPASKYELPSLAPPIKARCRPTLCRYNARSCSRLRNAKMTRFVENVAVDRHPSNYCNTVDFNGYIARKPGRLNGRSGWRRRREESGINRIHFAEIAHISQKHGRLHNVLGGSSRGLDDRDEVLHHSAGLALNGLVVDNV